MLNFTNQQVEDFKEWKRDSLKRIDFMQAVIARANPKKYEENKFFQKLTMVKAELDGFHLRNSSAIYDGEEIRTERMLGSRLQLMCRRIQRYMGKSALFEEQITKLEKMFEI